MRFRLSYCLAGASPLPLDVGCLFLVGSNILLSTVVQQQFVILEFSQEKMSTYPSTPPSCSQTFIGSITMNKPSGGDGIPAELFQILKDDAVKGLHSVCQQIWKTQQWPQDLIMSVIIPIPMKGNAEECSY